MIYPSQAVRIVIATKPVDFRKCHDGLAALAERELGRGGKHATEFLTGFSGTLQVDGYTGYNALTKPGRNSGPVKLAYCWAGNPPFLTGCGRRTHAAIFSFMAGVIPPMPMLGRSLL